MSKNKSTKKQKSNSSSPVLTTLVPVSLLRSSLFGISGDGEHISDHPIIPSDKRLAGTEIRYTGPYLTQEHFKVWQACIYLSQQSDNKLGSDITVANFTDLLKLCGRNTRDYRQYKKVYELMNDMVGAKLNVKTWRVEYAGTLISEISRDRDALDDEGAQTFIEDLAINTKGPSTVRYRLNNMLAQFLSNETLKNDILRLAEIGRDQLASWLHNYYATHKDPPPLTVQELIGLCKSPLDPPQFKSRLQRSLKKLTTGIRPLITKWSIDKNNIVRVEKCPTTVDMRSPDQATKDAHAKWKSEKDRELSKSGKSKLTGVNAPRGFVM